MERKVKVEKMGEKSIAEVTTIQGNTTTIQREEVTLAQAYQHIASMQQQREQALVSHQQLIGRLDAELAAWEEIVAQLKTTG